jgi:periplasmic protein TonB
MKRILVLLIALLGIYSCENAPLPRSKDHRNYARAMRHKKRTNRRQPTAVFPIRKRSLKEWVISHTDYPQEAVELGIEGKVIVLFAIDPQGNVGSVKIVQPAHPLLNKEALRVIRSLPKWNPERKNGKPVWSYYRIPITFRLQ